MKLQKKIKGVNYVFHWEVEADERKAKRHSCGSEVVAMATYIMAM